MFRFRYEIWCVFDKQGQYVDSIIYRAIFVPFLLSFIISATKEFCKILPNILL